MAINIVNATDDFRTVNAPHAVVVPRGVKFLKRGGVHQASRDMVVRMARKIAPQYKDAGCMEIFFGAPGSKNTVVTFDPEQPVNAGF